MKPEIERYEIIIASPRDHEELVSEIYFDGLFIAQLSMEKGPDAIELEIADATLVQTMVCRKVGLKSFLEAIEFARQRLVGEQP
jgi:hypothetical protein